MIARILHAAVILSATSGVLWLVWLAAARILGWPEARAGTVALAVFMVWFAVAAYGVALEDT